MFLINVRTVNSNTINNQQMALVRAKWSLSKKNIILRCIVSVRSLLNLMEHGRS